MQIALGPGMRHTSKKVFLKIPPYPSVFPIDTGSLPSPGECDISLLNLKSDRKYAGVSVGETRE